MDTMISNQVTPRILIADDDPCVVRAVADRCVQMGFGVETASNGLQALIKASQQPPDILVIDVHLPEVDGLSVLAFLAEAAKKSSNVVVMTGRPGPEILKTCDGLEALCIRKGPSFWSEFEARLTEMYPAQAIAIRQSAERAAKLDVKPRPRVLLVDDDFSVKKFFFHKFEKLGADLLHAADGTRGFWKARRMQPSVIVADYCMPNGDAEYLLTRLRSAPETASIPVIVQTGRRLDDKIKQRLRQPFCGHQGATRILQKSFDGRELFDALQRLCGFASDLDGDLLYQ
jgi:CheY-like chemotaxis protein